MTSSSHKMSCETCRDALTEYVCGELDAAAAGALRDHVATCAECAAQLARFERVMSEASAVPLEVASPRVREQVMAQAREALTRRAPEKPLTGVSDAAPGGFQAWLSRLGHWAMGPQVAMAAVLLLMVGIGIYTLPFGATEPQAALTPGLPTEAAESPQSAVATGSPIAADDAERARDGLSDPSEEREQSNDVYAEEKASSAGSARSRFAPKPASRTKGSRSEPQRKDVSAERDDLADRSGMGGIAKKAATPSKSEGASVESSAQRTATQFAPPPAPAPVKSRAAGASTYGGGSPMEESVSNVPAASAPADSARTAAGDLEAGIQRAQSGDWAEAIRILRPLTSAGADAERQKARLWLARAYRGSGQCASALPLYATFVARKDASSAVLSEAADCYARTGDEAQAAALRARLKSATETK